MQFVALLFDANAGAIVERYVSADTAENASASLSKSGLTVLSCVPVSTQGTTQHRRRNSTLDIAWWCRELRTLLVAGMTVVEALQVLHLQAAGTERASLHEQVVQRLEAGAPLSTAMADVGAFPAILVSGVKASERTSNLVQALDDYLKYHEIIDGLRKRVTNAAIYPALVCALGLLVSAFLLMFVMPRFAGMYTSAASISGVTQAILGFSRFMNAHVPHALLLLALIGAGTYHAWCRGSLTKALVKVVTAPRFVDRQVDAFRRAKMYQALSLMVRGGYSLPEALELASRLELGSDFDARIRKAQLQLMQGRPVSKVLSECGLTDEVSARLMQVGERTGDFHVILSTLAQRNGETFSLFVERATRIAEPVMLLAVSLLVGGLVVLMYLPVFDIANSIQ
jgi:general secretion pathway protein F